MAIPFQITQDDIADAEDIDFEEVNERYNVYKLNDGSVLLVKVPLLKVKRLKKHQPDGDPIYLVSTAPPITRVTKVPAKLKVKPQQPKEAYR